jgi:hypothetical protein
VRRSNATEPAWAITAYVTHTANLNIASSKAPDPPLAEPTPSFTAASNVHTLDTQYISWVTRVCLRVQPGSAWEDNAMQAPIVTTVALWAMIVAHSASVFRPTSTAQLRLRRSASQPGGHGAIATCVRGLGRSTPSPGR